MIATMVWSTHQWNVSFCRRCPQANQALHHDSQRMWKKMESKHCRWRSQETQNHCPALIHFYTQYKHTAQLWYMSTHNTHTLPSSNTRLTLPSSNIPPLYTQQTHTVCVQVSVTCDMSVSVCVLVCVSMSLNANKWQKCGLQNSLTGFTDLIYEKQQFPLTDNYY